MPVSGPTRLPVRAREISPTHRRRLLIHRTIVSVLVIGLSTWLAFAALAPTSGLIERALMLLIAGLLPIHVIFFHLGGIMLIDRARRIAKPLAVALAFVALAASPMVLYPLGAIAVLVAIFSGGGAAAPALTVTGLLMLSPIFALILIALMFATSRYKP